jgi:hypothetical protein
MGNVAVGQARDENNEVLHEGSYLIMRTQRDGNGHPLYTGFAAPGSEEDEAVWQIKKWVNNPNFGPDSSGFAEGNADFHAVWDDRSGYDYS